MPNDKALRQTALRKLVAEVNAHCWTWKTGGAVLGLCGGIVSAFAGSVLTALTWIAGPDWNGLLIQRDGTVLLFLTIPLLIFGGHCLDLMDKQDEEARKRHPNQIR